MGKSYKCDMSGKLVDGEGVKTILVPISEGFALLVHPQEVLDASHTAQGEVSPESAEKITGALATLRTKAFQKKLDGETVE